MSIATIINGDARRLPLADGSVHCVVTSPPYFGLRDYGTAAWEGGDDGCDHVRPADSLGGMNGKQPTNAGSCTVQFRDLCGKCGARRVDRQIGLEATPDLFVATMVEVFREVRRVLRDDGTAWVNLGDSYASSGISGTQSDTCNLSRHGTNRCGPKMVGQVFGRSPTPPGIGPKQLLMMPHRVALALQADGWIVRSDCVWAKPNPMPESVTDRPTKSHEYVFLMSKRERYFFDADAVREKTIPDPRDAMWGKTETTSRHDHSADLEQGMMQKSKPGFVRMSNPAGRNLRSVWTIPTHAWPGSHFATFPPELVRRCVKAGTSEKGCCPSCGAGWEREIETTYEPHGNSAKSQQKTTYGERTGGDIVNGCFRPQEMKYGRASRIDKTLGWRPSCSCPDHAPIPATVLDPFAGSGTTGVVATGLNRRFVGVELSPDYCRMAVRRISRPHASQRTGRSEDHPLFAGVE